MVPLAGFEIATQNTAGTLHSLRSTSDVSVTDSAFHFGGPAPGCPVASSVPVSCRCVVNCGNSPTGDFSEMLRCVS